MTCQHNPNPSATVSVGECFFCAWERTHPAPATAVRQVTFLLPKPEKKPSQWDGLVESLRG